jgi:hypothetical protein
MNHPPRAKAITAPRIKEPAMDFQLVLIGYPISLLMGVEEQCTPLCHALTKYFSEET